MLYQNHWTAVQVGGAALGVVNNARDKHLLQYDADDEEDDVDSVASGLPDELPRVPGIVLEAQNAPIPHVEHGVSVLEYSDDTCPF